jgi:hypothetical protein
MHPPVGDSNAAKRGSQDFLSRPPQLAVRAARRIFMKRSAVPTPGVLHSN